MLYNSQNTINVATLFSLEKYHTLYRFSNGYGASVIRYFNSDDVEVSVLTFSSDDILDYAVTTATSVITGTLISLKSNDFVDKMIQIERLV
jgi:hypothetical protein